MRRLSAHYIFPISSPPIKNGIIEIDDNGKIISISSSKKNNKEMPQTEFYNGILVPGFINTHCHLELSALHKRIKPHQGLTSFIESIQTIRQTIPREKHLEAITFFDHFMYQQGIVAVGDICNTDLTISTKTNSKLYYHSFIEMFSLPPAQSKSVFNHAKNLQTTFNNFHLKNSITIHSPYSVSTDLIKLAGSLPSNNRLSVHYLETIDERHLLNNHSGDLAIFFQKHHFFIDSLPTNMTPTNYLAHHLNTQAPVLFVHNLAITPADINTIETTFREPYWSLCPSSNLFLHQQLPNIQLLQTSSIPITIGTDSPASNTTLSILHELKILNREMPFLSLHDLLTFATINGAKALGIDSQFGTLENGKKPGINLIEQIDLQNLTLTQNSQLKHLI